MGWLPEWDTGEWAAIIAATFTAGAAVAAWLSARASLTVLRRARVPFVSGAVHRGVPSGRISLGFANTGPTLAIQVMYFVVGPGWRQGGTVGDGHLTAGEKVTIDTAYLAADGADQKTYLVWGWRDLDDNVYTRSDEWKMKHFSRRRWLRRKDTTLGGMFREMYPKVEIPQPEERPATLPRGGSTTDDREF
jgi:hypothetical protein